MNYESLRPWATERQCEFIDAIRAAGSVTQAAILLGVNIRSIQRSLKTLTVFAASKGHSPEHSMTRTVPEPFVVKGVSTYYNKEGAASGQWVKSKLSEDAYLEAIKAAAKSFCESIPAQEVRAAPIDRSFDIVPWLQIGDAHLGMLAHRSETGQNFDLKIAERELCAAIGALIDEMPACDRCVINDLGDFTHYENFSATTEASGHSLDFDTRYPKMIAVYVRTMRFIVDKCLSKAQNVDIIINQGNHSRTNDIWMAILLRAAYEHTGRVHVLNNDNVFIGYRMGNTLVMTHHSDKCKPQRLRGVMTSDFRKDFGETEFHYIDIGHVHHHAVSKDETGIMIESWNTLAPNDKWAHDAGYRATKSITLVFRSRKYGEVGRRSLGTRELADLLNMPQQISPAYTPQ